MMKLVYPIARTLFMVLFIAIATELVFVCFEYYTMTPEQMNANASQMPSAMKISRLFYRIDSHRSANTSAGQPAYLYKTYDETRLQSDGSKQEPDSTSQHVYPYVETRLQADGTMQKPASANQHVYPSAESRLQFAGTSRDNLDLNERQNIVARIETVDKQFHKLQNVRQNNSDQRNQQLSRYRIGKGCNLDYRNTSLYLTNPDPVSDFRKYPCVSGLPVFPENKWSTDGKCVRTFCYTESGKSTEGCVPLRTLRGTTPICTYPKDKDIWVSASLQKHGQWEGDLVSNLANLLASQPDLEFLDLGCNIGTYTLSIAHQGTKVTAVDPMIENLELLSQSLKLGNLQQYVTLIWNAVSNQRVLVTFKADKNNVGGTRIQNVKQTNFQTYMARTITLDDLLPMFSGKRIVIKMDIEESEYNALLGAKRFLDEVDIVVIQMEFAFHKTGPDGLKIVQFLSSRGFYPFRDINGRNHLYSSPFLTWPGDIYFMKSLHNNVPVTFKTLQGPLRIV